MSNDSTCTKALYKFSWNLYYTQLHGTFLATPTEIEEAKNKLFYFGEVAGKHSEVSGYWEEFKTELVSEDQDMIELFESYGLIFGYNPLDYISEDDE